MSLEDLGYTAQFADAFSAHADAGLSCARVTRMDRGRVWIHDGDSERTLPLTGAFITDPPAVGDFVAIDDANGRLVVVLDRTQALYRRRAGSATEQQAVAANIDVVLALSPADRLNASWIERAMALSWDAGASPVVVVTKADLLDDPEETARELETRTLGAALVFVAALEGEGLDVVRAQIPPQKTAVLIGPSGAGKSTLLNALMGKSVAATGAVRDGDHKGRHTTVRRELHVLPHGGLLIDTPGTRELGLVDAEGSAGFSDIDALAEECRFRDCAHVDEPGCAVRAAVDDGRLEAERYESFQRQMRERRWLEEKAVGHDHASRERGKRLARMVKDAKSHKKVR